MTAIAKYNEVLDAIECFDNQDYLSRASVQELSRQLGILKTSIELDDHESISQTALALINALDEVSSDFDEDKWLNRWEIWPVEFDFSIAISLLWEMAEQSKAEIQ